mmetsp:Transcript_12592/g.30916  ORF Transcript_12592/g.30916 Transcript_12592/m.30916 type:complete len:540 (-) Transcript_12592:141-1760(-)
MKNFVKVLVLTFIFSFTAFGLLESLLSNDILVSGWPLAFRQTHTRFPVMHRNQTCEDSELLEFEGTDDWLTAMRMLQGTKRCSAKARRHFLRGGAPGHDWVGYSLTTVSENSCDFVTREFPPSQGTVESLLKQQVHSLPLAKKTQCSHLTYNHGKVLNCSRNHFGIMYTSEEHCKNLSYGMANDVLKGAICIKGHCVAAVTRADVSVPLFESLPASIEGKFPPSPYLVYAQNATISFEGHVVMTVHESYTTSCAPYWQTIAAKVEKKSSEGLKACEGRQEGQCRYTHVEKCMHVLQVYETGTFHFMAEVFPRVAPFLDVLLQDKAIMIFSLRAMRDSGPALQMHGEYFELLGISRSRLIDSVPVLADEVMIPRAGYSHNPVLNMWNLLAVRRAVELHLGCPPQPSNARILIIQRDSGRRMDSHIFKDEWTNQFAEKFPSHEVVWFKSSNSSLMLCKICQVRVFQNADCVAGAHGAGLSNMMWMRRGSTVIEFSPHEGDSLIYAEMAFSLGHRYFAVARKAELFDEISDIIHLVQRTRTR